MRNILGDTIVWFIHSGNSGDRIITYHNHRGHYDKSSDHERNKNEISDYLSAYRVGGDEFCVILNEKIEKTEELNARFVSAIKKLQAVDDRMPDVSMGYAFYDASVSHIQNVIEEADIMLYRNKKVEIEVVWFQLFIYPTWIGETGGAQHFEWYYRIIGLESVNGFIIINLWCSLVWTLFFCKKILDNT